MSNRLKRNQYIVPLALLFILLINQQCSQDDEVSIERDSFIEFEIDGQQIRQEADFIEYDSLVHYPNVIPIWKHDKVNIGYTYTIYSLDGGLRLTTYRPIIALRIEYDSSLFYKDELGRIKFKDVNDFYNSFHSDDVPFYDLDDRNYPNASFYLQDTLSQDFTSHGEVSQNIDFLDENYNFQITTVQKKNHFQYGEGVVLEGNFSCDIYERETISKSEIRNGNFRIFIRQP